MTNPEQTQPSAPGAGAPSPGAPGLAGDPQSDDRRGTVEPNDHPVPSSPEPDAEALRAGEEALERVKPY